MAGMTVIELAHKQAFPVPGGIKGMTYGMWLVGQALPKVIEQMEARSGGPPADAKDIAFRTMSIVNEMLTRMTSSGEEE